MVKVIEETEKYPRSKVDAPADEHPAQETPIEELVQVLREQFKIGLAHQAAQKEAARRRRAMIWIVCLAVLAVGILVAAAVIGIAIHRPR